MLKVLNPKNNIRLSALTNEPLVESTDLALFDDASAVTSQKARTTTWANIFARLFNLDQYAAATTIADADSILFRDSTVVSGQSAKTITFANFATKLLLPVVNGLIPTGVGVPWFGGNAPTGWVWLSGRSIGDATSGATERANADTANLFALLWNNFDNTVLPIQTSGGMSTTRGSSAAADYAAHKRFPLPDARGRSIFGLDNMGGIAANRLTSAFGNVDGVTPGAVGGQQSSGLAAQNIPQHTHAVTVYRVDTGPVDNNVALDGGVTRRFLPQNLPLDTGTLTATTPYGQNGPDPFTNVPPAFVAWWILKL